MDWRRRVYTSDTDGYWLPFSTAATSGRGVGHRPFGMGPCTAPDSFARARARGGHARPCSRLEYRFEVDLDADLPGDQEPAAVQGQVPAETPSLAVEGAVGRETARRPSLGATWPRYSACRLTGRVMPQMVSSPASMPRVPCQRAARLEREAVGGGGWYRSRHVNRPRTLVSMKWRPMKATSVWPGSTCYWLGAGSSARRPGAMARAGAHSARPSSLPNPWRPSRRRTGGRPRGSLATAAEPGSSCVRASAWFAFTPGGGAGAPSWHCCAAGNPDRRDG